MRCGWHVAQLALQADVLGTQRLHLVVHLLRHPAKLVWASVLDALHCVLIVRTASGQTMIRLFAVPQSAQRGTGRASIEQGGACGRRVPL